MHLYNAYRPSVYAAVAASLFVAPLILFGTASPSSAQSGRDWGAIFYSDQSPSEFGSAWNYESAQAARRAALSECENAGGRNCELAIEFRTNECGAVAEGPNSWGADFGANRHVASDKALDECRREGGGCKVIEVACNSGLDDGSNGNNNQQSNTDYEQLVLDLQAELSRMGCLRGRVDGVWGNGSRRALYWFSQIAKLNLGSEPSQRALDEARDTEANYCY